MRQRVTLVALIVVVGVIAVVQILRTQSVAQARAATPAQALHPVDRTMLPIREPKIDFVDHGAGKPVAIAPMALPSHAQHAGPTR